MKPNNSQTNLTNPGLVTTYDICPGNGWLVGSGLMALLAQKRLYRA